MNERVRIGPGRRCFIAAEVGINHNGDMDIARRAIEEAAAAGADAVKFQNYRTEDFLSDRTLTHAWTEADGTKHVESQFDMFRRCELSQAQLADLRAHCEDRGVVFFSTPTGEDGVRDLVRLGAPLLKNGSDYLVNLPLIRVMAGTGLPTILSTGMATLADIDDAVRAFREAGGTELVLLVCTSSYPTPSDQVHLRRIEAMRLAFGLPIGFSDHTLGTVAAVGAVALGAVMVEKHFTLDKTMPGPDHAFSSDPVELRALVEAIRTLEASLGDATLGPTASESMGRRDYRLSCVAARPLAAGSVLAEKDVAFRRPGTGLPPAGLSWLLGRAVRREVPAGHVLEPSDFA
ncbi:MAG: N-acetylneuraminate synthase family protein [Polyangiaceae bacterium]